MCKIKTKIIATETKSLNFFIFAKTLNFAINIGTNTQQSPNKIESDAIKNQFPPVYIAQTPNNNSKAKKLESGINSNLFFFISFGRLVNVNAKIRAESTIQNQVNPLFTAKLTIKQGIIVRA